MKDTESAGMDDLQVRAKILMTRGGNGGKKVAALSTGGPAGMANNQFLHHPHVDEQSGRKGETYVFQDHCFRCGGPHMVRSVESHALP